MARLHIDDLTASVALVDLAARGNDLTTLAQSLDEDWKRFAVDASLGTRHLISTMGNRQDCPPTGLTYLNTQLIQPDAVDARLRPVEQRFLKGKPLLCGELAMEGDDYRLSTALLRISLHVHATLDWSLGRASFHIQFAELPDTVMMAGVGRRLGDIVEVGHHDHLEVTGIRKATESDMREVLGHLAMEGVVVETVLPEWRQVEFTEIYAG